MYKTIVVIAGGYSVGSLKSTGLETIVRSSPTIAVNDAALHVQANYVLSMDRIWLEARLPVLVPARYRPDQLYIRKGVVKAFAPPDGCVEFDCDHREHRMSLLPGRYNGTNSGAAAVNLALHLAIQHKIQDVHLLGFDLRQGPAGEKHWYPSTPLPTPEGGERPNGTTKPSKFREWANQYEDIGRSFYKQKKWLINVVDPDHPSAILDLPTKTHREFLKEITGE